MTVQYGELARNARLDAHEVTVGTAPKLQIRSGAQPANCAAADSGVLLAEITLPSDWAAAAASGVKAGSGFPWTVNAVAAGTAAHYRLKNNAGTVTHEQGSVGTAAADLIVDNTNIANGQQVQITQWTKTEGNP